MCAAPAQPPAIAARCSGMHLPLPRLILSIAALGATAPALATAAPPWTAPSPIAASDGGPSMQVAAQLAGNDAGLAIAVSAGATRPGDIGPSTVGSVFDGERFGAPLSLSEANIDYGPHSGAVATYAKTRLLAAGHLSRRDSSQAVFAFGRLTAGGASLGSARHLGPGNLLVGSVALAVNAAGDAAMVYPVCRSGCSRALVYLAVRKHGSSTISSTRVFDGSGPMPRVAAAVNERGDALAVWTTASEIRARVRTLGGKLRGSQRVGPIARGTVGSPTASLSKHRGELVGWLSQAVHEGDAGPGIVYAGQARDGGSFSTPARLADIPPALGSAAFLGDTGVRVRFDPRGRRLLMWTGFESDRFVVRSAELLGAANSGRADPTDAVLVSDPAVDTVLSDMEVTPSGRQLALLTEGIHGEAHIGQPTRVVAALRPAGAEGPFQREPVSDGSTAALSADATITGPGRPLAIWSPLGGTDTTSQRSGSLP